MYRETQNVDAHDPHHMEGAGSDHNTSQTVTNYSGLLMGGSINNNNSLEETHRLKLPSLSLEDLSNHQNPLDASATAVAPGIDLQQQSCFKFEHEFTTQLMRDVLPDRNGTPALDQQQPQHAQQMGILHNLQCFNSTPLTSLPYPPMPDLGEAGRTHQFASVMQMIEQLNEKYKELRLLVPNTPTEIDRATVVGYAIDYIKELLGTVEELKNLVDKKRSRREMSTKLKLDDKTSVEMESS